MDFKYFPMLVGGVAILNVFEFERLLNIMLSNVHVIV